MAPARASVTMTTLAVSSASGTSARVSSSSRASVSSVAPRNRVSSAATVSRSRCGESITGTAPTRATAHESRQMSKLVVL